MAVQPTVTRLMTQERSPSRRVSGAPLPAETQAAEKARAGTKVTIAATPSRDSQEERHCVKARHARSGWLRCSVEAHSPTTIRPKDKPAVARAKERSSGSAPKAASTPHSASKP